jgi:uncharacterized protein
MRQALTTGSCATSGRLSGERNIGHVLRIAFPINIAAVIADSVLRKRFVEGQDSIGIRPLSTPTEVVVGIIIGTVASLLGVGGSVMTVPLMWRRGTHMRSARPCRPA